jgi:hypothetical protein
MIANVNEARQVQAAINAVIPDIKLFWNHEKERWVIAQVKQNPGGLVLPGFSDMPSSTRPFTLYVVQQKDGSYRAPSEWDVRQAIQIGRDGREAIEKGGDWLVDKVEAAERARKEAADERLRKKVQAIAPDIKRALRGDTQR